MRAGLLVIALALGSSSARAEDYVPPVVAIHGFVSPGYVLTTAGTNYLAKSSGSGSFELVEVGLNFTVPLTDRLRVGLQLFARDRGPAGNYDAKVDWFYLDYRWQDWLGLRAGRVKVPFGLYNEASDADSAHVPVLLPQSVYPIANRDFLLAQTGVELYGYIPIGAAGAIEYRVYGGTIFVEVDEDADIALRDLTIPYLVGTRLMWETPLQGLRVGASVQALRIETDIRLTEPIVVDAALAADALLWVASIEYQHGDVLASAEYSRWAVDSTSEPPVLPNDHSVSERMYAMLSYRMTRWFQPGLYYSYLAPDMDDRSGRESRQHDLALTLRFDIEEHWLLKLEAHYLDGTAALSSELNDDRPRSTLPAQWGLFLVKTTAHF